MASVALGKSSPSARTWVFQPRSTILQLASYRSIVIFMRPPPEAKLEKENEKLYAATQQVQASLSNTIASSAPLVNRALAQTSTSKWGVVFSGNPTLEVAKDEIDSVAEKYNLPNAAIYNRKGSYRSVSVVSDRQQAIQILSRAKEWRDDAYIVNMSTWCPNFKEETGIYECTLP